MTSTRKHPWSLEETELVGQLVALHGEANWKRVSAEFNARKLGPKRSCKQCRELWLNKLSPNVKKGEWSESELRTLYQCHQRFGSAWSKMTEFLPGRTENTIKNTFYGAIRKALKAYNQRHKDTSRILRTLKSLIHDKEVTVLLHLAESDEGTLLEDGTTDSQGDAGEETATASTGVVNEAPSVELTVPAQVMQAALLQQWWQYQQWMWLFRQY